MMSASLHISITALLYRSPVVEDSELDGPCPDLAAARWWLRVIEVAGKWYSQNPPLTTTTALCKTAAKDSTALCLSRRNELSPSLDVSHQEKALFALWISVRQACDMALSPDSLLTAGRFSETPLAKVSHPIPFFTMPILCRFARSHSQSI
ncbi:unnamed protein product [Dibothriocephalus latus]|uniref:Uncharacterized protein n=1 Tax=Dibothriocephalus latus TaxID=60516 RepID=A0A3P7NZV5_DIBLA|nr:unnamed protein product [Dibothriocephalus latus]